MVMAPTPYWFCHSIVYFAANNQQFRWRPPENGDDNSKVRPQYADMPGRLFLYETPDNCAAWLQATPPDGADGPRFNIAPGQDILVCPPDRVLRHMRWGMIPVGRVNARGRPVMETIVNARSETVFEKSAFSGVGRCVVPANGWYEWTGEKRQKTAWKIEPRNGGLLAFAAIYDIWKGPAGAELFQVATVTCAPSADVRDIHDRMGVLLAQGDIERWLTGDVADIGPLMVPYPDGALQVSQAIGVDWSAP